MNICLYGASSSALAPKYIEMSEHMGALLAQHGHTMVFGGGAHGIMGAAARGVTAENGSLIGVAPRFFNVKDILYRHCTEFVYTETMRERKAIMEERSDAFIVMPGGNGTFEEFLEILTLKQLGKHRKAIAVYNQDGFYEPMRQLFENCMAENFIKESNRILWKLCDTPEEVLNYIENYHGDYKSWGELKNL